LATDDQQVLVTGQASAPASWTVPGNGQITPRVVFASYDGTAAAAAFYPALKIVSDAGETVGIYPCGSSVAAGGSADVSWFPGVSAQAASSTIGAAAYIQRTSTDTFGPVGNHTMTFTSGTFITNDSAVFSSPSTLEIELASGGVVMCGLGGSFGTNGGVAYSNEFEMQTQILDSLNNPVDQIVGPDVYNAELYATDAGDTFLPAGYSVWNCDDASFTPPYTLKGFITVEVNVTFTNYYMYSSIVNPAGLA
jgi:hypothetical protein